jgi:hypothetical protein
MIELAARKNIHAAVYPFAAPKISQTEWFQISSLFIMVFAVASDKAITSCDVDAEMTRASLLNRK